MARKKKDMEIKETKPAYVKPPRQLSEEERRSEFKKYFIKLKRKLKLEQSMESVLWLHFKASGFDKPELFDKGIENFGYKL